MDIQYYNIEELVNSLLQIFPILDYEIITSVLFQEYNINKAIDKLIEITQPENNVKIINRRNSIINKLKKFKKTNKIKNIFKRKYNKYQPIKDIPENNHDDDYENLYTLDIINNISPMEWDYSNTLNDK